MSGSATLGTWGSCEASEVACARGFDTLSSDGDGITSSSGKIADGLDVEDDGAVVWRVRLWRGEFAFVFVFDDAIVDDEVEDVGMMRGSAGEGCSL